MELRDVLSTLDRYDNDSTISIGPDGELAPDASVTVVPASSDGSLPAGLRYVLEVSVAKEVLAVWSDWRAGRPPTADEAAAAVIYYATHDAYKPANQE